MAEVVVVLLTFLCCFSAMSCAGGTKKNVLFLMADDMRPNLGVYRDVNEDIFHQPWTLWPPEVYYLKKPMTNNLCALLVAPQH